MLAVRTQDSLRMRLSPGGEFPSFVFWFLFFFCFVVCHLVSSRGVHRGVPRVLILSIAVATAVVIDMGIVESMLVYHV